MELGSGKVAVVTGAGSGIGLAMAEALAKAGCSVVLADVQIDALKRAEETVAGHGVETLVVPTDVSNGEHVTSLAQATVDKFGGVHILCNNAGVAGAGDPWLGPIESWEWVMGVNFWGVVHGVRAFLPHIVMSGGGHIVNTASIAGLYPGFAPPYDASKHAVVAITESLYHSMQIAELPVGVSCLCPGWVKTGIIDSERNWPAEYGEAPIPDAVGEISRSYARRAIDEGMPPAAVADLVVEAVREGRYWIFPHQDFLEMAMERFHSIGDRLEPTQPEETPGMPARSLLIAEIKAAMAAQMAEQLPADEE
jgi:NAD(P)-dependent dehydrogenase (short-subunit alcohol dehydrogenase family)